MSMMDIRSITPITSIMYIMVHVRLHVQPIRTELRPTAVPVRVPSGPDRTGPDPVHRHTALFTIKQQDVYRSETTSETRTHRGHDDSVVHRDGTQPTSYRRVTAAPPSSPNPPPQIP
ncbi:unnamed protein product [Merluccius merluccius]